MKRSSLLALVLSLVMLVGIVSPVQTLASAAAAELVSGDFDLPLEHNGEEIISWEASEDGVIEIDTENKKAIVKKYDVDGAIDTSISVTTASGKYSVPYKVCYLPEGAEAFSENFDGETYVGETRGTWAHSDGQLVLTKEAAAYSSDVAMTYFPSKNTDAYSGKKIIEFDVCFDTENLSAMRMQIGKVSTTALMDLKFERNMFRAYNGSTANVEAESGSFDFSQKTKVTILTDTDAQTFSVWCNGQPAVRDFKYRESAEYFDRITFFMSSKAATEYGSAYLDNIAVYDIADVMSGIDSDEINNGITTGEAKYDLTLPSEDADGNPVTWTAADRYITVSGNRGRIHGSPVEQVESGVIANLQKNGITYMKKYSYTLPVSTLPVPVLGTATVYDEDFENISSFGDLRANTEYSVSSDGKLEVAVNNTDAYWVETGMYGTYIKFPEHKVTDTLVYEFELLCPSKGDSQLFIGAGPEDGGARSKNMALFSLTNSVYATDANSSNFDGTRLGAYSSANRNLSIVMEMKSDATWSLWIDGYRWVNNSTMRSTGENGLKDIRTLSFVTASGNASNMKLVIDNVRVYQGSTAQAEVDSLLSGLTSFEGIESGTISVAGSGDSEVTFSDTSGYVAADGTVTYPTWADYTDITANVFYGGYSASKTLQNVEIPSNFIVGSAVSGAADGGQPLSVTLSIAARNSGSKAAVVAAVYDAVTNELVGIGVNPDISAADGEAVITTGALPDDIDDTVIKVFVLDGLSAVRPIVTPVTPVEQ